MLNLIFITLSLIHKKQKSNISDILFSTWEVRITAGCSVLTFFMQSRSSLKIIMHSKKSRMLLIIANIVPVPEYLSYIEPLDKQRKTRRYIKI